VPPLTTVHGGPAAASVPSFKGPGLQRMLLERGYALFLPNPRHRNSGTRSRSSVFQHRCIYPGEGHRLRDPEHAADAMRRTLEWFVRYLK
jgi:dipeptidyl aminopeptidase/acylaminoacyl peptidase